MATLFDVLNEVNDEKKKGGLLEQLQDNIAKAIGHEVINSDEGQGSSLNAAVNSAKPASAANPGLFAGLKHGFTGAPSTGSTIPYALGQLPGSLMRARAGLNVSEPDKIAQSLAIEEGKMNLEENRRTRFMKENPTAVPKSMNVGGVTFEVPPSSERVREKAALEQEETDLKPLSGESATRYGGVTQGIKNIQKINETLSGLNEKEARDLIYRTNLAVNAASARDAWVPGGKGLYQMALRAKASNRITPKGVKADDKGLQLGNEFLTLSENLLRARTGAQAPEPEVVREFARTLLNSFFESPKTWNKKLQTNLDFLKGVGKEIRPLRKDEWDYSLDNKQATNSEDLGDLSSRAAEILNKRRNKK